MKVAIVGCGTMGEMHAQNFAKMPDVELVGVCSTRLKTAAMLAKKYNTKPFTCFDTMITKVRPNVISICLPTPLHKEYVLKAAEAGAHIICEKPIAGTLQEAKEMIEACRRYDVRLFIAHVVRFFPSYADLNEKVALGTIGKVGFVNARRAGPHPGEAKPWYKDPDSGGVIMDLLIHDIDFMRGMLGEVESVYAVNRITEHLDYALVTLRFRQGALVHLEAFWGAPGLFTTAVEVIGEKGTARFDSNATTTMKIAPIGIVADDAKKVAVPGNPAAYDPYYGELRHFLDCIQDGKEPIITAEDGYKALEIALAAIESARLNEPIFLEEFGSEQVGRKEA